MERVFAFAFERAFAGVVFIDVDEAVAFVHFAGGGGDDVDWGPHGVAEQLDTVFVDGFDHLSDVRAQVVDAVGIMDFTIFEFVVGTEAVFDDEHRQLIAVVEPVQGVTQPDWINLPPPIAGFDEFITDEIALFIVIKVRIRLFVRNAEGHVVGEAEIVDFACEQILFILFGNVEIEAFAGVELLHVGRVVAAHVHVGEPVAFLHRRRRKENVLGFAGGRIDRAHRDHAADLEIGIDGVADFDGPGAGYEFIMGGLVHQFFAVVPFFQQDTAVLQQVVRRFVVGLVVDFIERHPIGDFVFIAGEAGFGEFFEKANAFPIAETAIRFDEVPRHFEMRQRDDGLDAVLAAFVEQIVIERQSFLVRRLFIAVRENARPGNRCPETLEAHFRHQGDVFFVVVIEVDRFMVGIAFSGDDPVGDPARHPVGAGRHDVGDAKAFAAHLPAAFNLMGSYCAAP